MFDLMSYLKLCGTVAKNWRSIRWQIQCLYIAENYTFVLYALSFKITFSVLIHLADTIRNFITLFLFDYQRVKLVYETFKV